MKQIDGDTFAHHAVERNIVSLCLQDKDNYIEAAAKLSPVDFLNATYRTLYSVIGKLYDSEVEVLDTVTVGAYLAEHSLLDSVGGYEFIEALNRASVDRRNLNSFVNVVLNSSILYGVYNQLDMSKNGIVAHVKSNDDVDAASVLASIEADLMDVSLKTMRVEDGKYIYEGLLDKIKSFEENNTEIVGVPVGFNILDRALNGLSAGGLYVVAARPKVGKSTLLSNWALNIITSDIYEKKAILYIDTEMSFEEFQLRAVSNISKVPERLIKTGAFARNELLREQVYSAIETLSNLSLIHKFMPGFKIDDVVSIVKKYKAKEDISVLFFDYIKMVEMGDNFNETQTLGHITMMLKDLAGLLNIPVVTAVQLNRESDGKSFISSKHIADSDRVLRYCNVLMGLAPKSPKEIEEHGISCGTHRLQILENRSGPSFPIGIDLEVKRTILTMVEASQQSPPAEEEQRILDIVI